MWKKLLIILFILFMATFSYGCKDNTKNNISNASSDIELKPTQESITVTALSLQSKVGDRIYLGSYNQDNNPLNGKEPIVWQILSVENNKAILISEYGLDVLPYHNEKYVDVTWESCTLRAWLNSDFYDTIFSEKEKAAIMNVELENNNNPEFGTIGGNSTKDNVFILSLNEVKQYLPNENTRRTTVTDYAKSKNAYIIPNGYCTWWLRSPGFKPFTALAVSVGYISNYGNPVLLDYLAIRPSLWIDILQFNKTS